MLGILHTLAIHISVTDEVDEAVEGGEPADENREVRAAIAPVEHIKHHLQQTVKGHKHGVDARIDDGDGDDPARHHGAEGGKREEEQTRQLRHGEPCQDALPRNDTVAAHDQHGDDDGDNMHHGEDLHAHKEMVKELLRAVHRQGVQ